MFYTIISDLALVLVVLSFIPDIISDMYIFASL
jgi:hypothetical protein